MAELQSGPSEPFVQTMIASTSSTDQKKTKYRTVNFKSNEDIERVQIGEDSAYFIISPRRISSHQIKELPSFDVARIGKTSSAMVLCFLVFVYLVGLVSGFHAVSPPLSILGAWLSALMYLVSWMVGRQWKKH